MTGYVVRHGRRVEVETFKAEAPRRQRRTPTFVKLPYEQCLVAAGKLRSAELAVLLELAHQSFRRHTLTVPLSNAALDRVGVRRRKKLAALRTLEVVGLVSVTWRGKQCPLVTILWVSGDYPMGVKLCT
jgi:hypothetical protein